MFKSVRPTVWVYDLEWVPDPAAGRLLYPLFVGDGSDHQIVDEMYRQAGATEEDPRPMVKLVASKICSLACVARTVKNDEVSISIASLTKDDEAGMIKDFLTGIGQREPQLVGYNSVDSDFRILLQRALVLGVQAGKFFSRPDKPWTGIDYFVDRDNDAHVDLCRIYGGWKRGPQVPKLHEICTLAGIPGKILIDGGDNVAALWLAGDWERIRLYNIADALSTYLLWLRSAYIAGFFAAEQYDREQALLRSCLETKPELEFYLKAWLG